MAGLASAAVFGVAALAAPVQTPPSGADQLSAEQAQAAQLEQQIQADNNRLDILSQQYDAAQQRVQQLDQQLSANEAAVAATRRRVTTAKATLRRAALAAYMAGSVETGLEAVFDTGSPNAAAAQEYRAVNSSHLQSALDGLRRADAALAAQQRQVRSTRNQAQAAATEVVDAERQARTVEAAQQATLSRVKGSIAILIAQRKAVEAAAQAAAFRARVAAERAAQQAAAQQAAQRRAAAAVAASVQAANRQAPAAQVPNPSPTPAAGPSSPPAASPPAGSGGGGPQAGGGQAAVDAARSQLGVPYVWGGEQPGVGFDCSGLTQWAWRQAGVSLPRTAEEQWLATTHIPLADLQPGDLVFWNDGTSSVQHVAIFVGGDEVIQAPHPGTTVSYSTIWTNGLVGAGQP